MDSKIDFRDYDTNSDGYVDYIFFLLPRRPFGNFDQNTMGGYGNWVASYTTNDGVYIPAGNGCSVGSTYQAVKGYQGLSSFVSLCVHEYGHFLGLDDKYDEGGDPANPYALSGTTGMYSVMKIVGYEPTITHIYPLSPYDKISLGWVIPIGVSQSTYNVAISDFCTYGTCYKVPAAGLEYFLVVNHQKLNHWENEYKRAGFLIWHINENLENWNPNEKEKLQDVECAIGDYDTSGAWPGLSSPMPDSGYDNIDFYCPHNWSTETWFEQFEQDHNGTAGASTDFFREDYKMAFDHLTNPNSDGYDLSDPYNFVYPAGSIGSYQWPEVTEVGYLQPLNKPTNIAVRNIITEEPPINGHNMRCDILYDYSIPMKELSNIWDHISSTQRRVVYDPNIDRFYRVYSCDNKIYYTYTSNFCSGSSWSVPVLLGNGRMPTISLDNYGKPCVAWVNNKTYPWHLYFRYRNWDGSWSALKELATGGENTLPPWHPSLAVDDTNGVHIVVHHYRVTEFNVNQIEVPPDGITYIVYYGYKKESSNPTVYCDTLETYSAVDLSASSIVFEHRPPHPLRIHLVYGADFRPYYRVYEYGQWSARFPLFWSIVPPVDPYFKRPFIDIDGDSLHVVCSGIISSWNTIEEIYHTGKHLDTDYRYLSNWLWPVNVSQTPSQLSSDPQIEDGNCVVWREEIDPDSFQIVYKLRGESGTPHIIQKTSHGVSAPDAVFQVTENVERMCISWTETEWRQVNLSFVSEIDLNTAYVEREVGGPQGGVTPCEGEPRPSLSVSSNLVTGRVIINYEVPNNKNNVELSVFDVMGRKVKKFLVNTGRIEWNLRDEAGRKFSPGIYFVRLETGDYKVCKKLVILK